MGDVIERFCHLLQSVASSGRVLLRERASNSQIGFRSGKFEWPIGGTYCLGQSSRCRNRLPRVVLSHADNLSHPRIGSIANGNSGVHHRGSEIVDGLALWESVTDGGIDGLQAVRKLLQPELGLLRAL